MRERLKQEQVLNRHCRITPRVRERLYTNFSIQKRSGSPRVRERRQKRDDPRSVDGITCVCGKTPHPKHVRQDVGSPRVCGKDLSRTNRRYHPSGSPRVRERPTKRLCFWKRGSPACGKDGAAQRRASERIDHPACAGKTGPRTLHCRTLGSPPVRERPLGNNLSSTCDRDHPCGAGKTTRPGGISFAAVITPRVRERLSNSLTLWRLVDHPACAGKTCTFSIAANIP